MGILNEKKQQLPLRSFAAAGMAFFMASGADVMAQSQTTITTAPPAPATKTNAFYYDVQTPDAVFYSAAPDSTLGPKQGTFSLPSCLNAAFSESSVSGYTYVHTINNGNIVTGFVKNEDIKATSTIPDAGCHSKLNDLSTASQTVPESETTAKKSKDKTRIVTTAPETPLIIETPEPEEIIRPVGGAMIGREFYEVRDNAILRDGSRSNASSLGVIEKYSCVQFTANIPQSTSVKVRLITPEKEQMDGFLNEIYLKRIELAPHQSCVATFR